MSRLTRGYWPNDRRLRHYSSQLSLILINQAHLLQALYSFVVIPQAVHDEMQRADTPVEIREWIDNRPNWLEVRPSPSFDLNLKLGVGEREAITLALELKAEAILLDDIKARIEAQNKGLVVIGTLAILATAAHRGLVDLPAAIARLQQTNFRAPADLIQLILDQDHTKKGT